MSALHFEVMMSVSASSLALLFQNCSCLVLTVKIIVVTENPIRQAVNCTRDKGISELQALVGQKRLQVTCMPLVSDKDSILYTSSLFDSDPVLHAIICTGFEAEDASWRIHIFST